MSNDGEVYCHEKDKSKTGLSFHQGNVVTVETNDNRLVITNHNEKWMFEMEMKLTNKEWGEACFCVNSTRIHGSGPSISIV
jgi:hypothetical protein